MVEEAEMISSLGRKRQRWFRILISSGKETNDVD